jgi:hypothetical protein
VAIGTNGGASPVSHAIRISGRADEAGPGEGCQFAHAERREGMSEHYIYQYWVVSEDDYSHVYDGPFNSKHEAWLAWDDHPYKKVVKTKCRVLETSED